MKALHILRLLIALPFLLLALAPLPGHADASDSIFTRPKNIYLALGDSLSFGYQQYKVNAALATTGTVDPRDFTTGFVDDFTTQLKTLRPALRTVNFGCPGETSGTFITGGCPYPYPLHNSYSGSQLAAALDFLRHHGQVSPITLDLGANDLLGLINTCGGIAQTACITAGEPGILATVATNLTQILAALRQASPRSEIIVLQLYNPLAVLAPSTNAITQPLNAVIAAVAAGAQARLADAFTPFNLAQPQPQTLCALTLFCTPLHDVHASDAGYQVIAQQFWTASGYSSINSGERDPETSS
ncbi:MAG TPA: SGNH/GDSL hydrolase family protein [Chloroflexota bacterium]|nr:SGNH/GDSL hydrolase family protein [Chloroflexota bacterium]